jgi:aminoglycoside phosphotransferase (APT) family kinase protein
MSEAAGGRELVDWIKCLEKARPLPCGVDLERVERSMAVAAEALSELQRTGVRPRGRRTAAGELARLDKDRRLLDRVSGASALVRRIEELLRRLHDQVPAREELVPAHGGFRHKQMVGDERSLAVIDWDGLCLADPALDAATFLGRLRRDAASRPGRFPEMERLADTFRREFLARCPWVSARHLDLYESVALTEGALRSFRRAARSEKMLQRIEGLVAAAEQALERTTGSSPA